MLCTSLHVLQAIYINPCNPECLDALYVHSSNMSYCAVLCCVLPLSLTGEVLLNMLRAHTAAYKAIRALPNGGEFKVMSKADAISI